LKATRRKVLAPLLVLGLSAGLFLVLGQIALAGPPTTALVKFGNGGTLGNRPPPPVGATPCLDQPGDATTGKPKCFPRDHDKSAIALDNIVPNNVVIAAGGTVTFYRPDNLGNHRVAIYAPGTDLDALKTAAAASVPIFFDIDLPALNLDRLELGPTPANWKAPVYSDLNGDGNIDWTTSVSTFNTAGKYLIVCTFKPHFLDNDMYSWVTVK
jgi:plastocyanin